MDFDVNTNNTLYKEISFIKFFVSEVFDSLNHLIGCYLSFKPRSNH